MREGFVRKSINEICDKASSNIAQNKIKGMNGDYPVYGASGYVQNIDFYHRDADYIGIVKDGSGVGRVNIYPAYSSLLGTMQYIIPKDGHLLGYVAYALKGLNLSSFASGAAIPHIYFKDYGKCKISVPPLAEQERIVAELDLLSSIIDKKKAQLKELDQLAQSIFYTMFGDLLNVSPTHFLKDIASYYIGLTYKPTDVSEEGTIVLRSSNIQNNILDFNDTVRVSVNINENKIVHNGDILMCARNGSARLVGKVARIKNISEKMSFGAFMTIIRSEYNDYLFHFFLSDFFRSQLITSKTATINQITSRMLDNIKIILPPLSLQQEFAEKVEAIEKQKALVQQSIAETQTLFDSRMDHWFS